MTSRGREQLWAVNNLSIDHQRCNVSTCNTLIVSRYATERKVNSSGGGDGAADIIKCGFCSALQLSIHYTAGRPVRVERTGQWRRGGSARVENIALRSRLTEYHIFLMKLEVLSSVKCKYPPPFQKKTYVKYFAKYSSNNGNRDG